MRKIGTKTKSTSKAIYQLTVLDRLGLRQVAFRTEDKDAAIARLNQIDARIHYDADMLMRAEAFQSIELQQVEVLTTIVWNAKDGGGDDCHG